MAQSTIDQNAIAQSTIEQDATEAACEQARAEWEAEQDWENMEWPSLPADVETALLERAIREHDVEVRLARVGGSTPSLVEVLLGRGFPRPVAEHLAHIGATLSSDSRVTRPAAAQVPGVGGEAPSVLSAPVEPVGDGRVASDEALTAAVDGTVVVSRWLEGQLVTLAEQMNVAAGRELLARAGVASVDELGKTKRNQWRASSKAAVANEIRLLTGKTLQACHDLVGFAMAPAAATAPARAAMATGQVDWHLAHAWYDKCRNLPHHDAAAIAARIFPTAAAQDPDGDAEPDEDRDGDDSDGDESHDVEPVARTSTSEFNRNLNREITRVQGKDPASQRAKRKKARDERGMFLTVDDDGTATITLRGPTSAVVGAYDRADVIARKARAAGDERTIRQLAVDAVLALATHGTLPSTVLTTDQSSGADGATRDAGDGPLVDHTTLAQVIAGLGPVHLDVIVPLDALLNPESSAVGEIANHGIFLTAEQVREIALAPGTTLHRLLTDPVTGNCVERSRKSYAPDRAMREQIAAADRLCRAPGCTVPASRCQFDHVEPFDHDDPDRGGPTAMSNLGLEHGADHSYKTRGLIEALLDAESRKMTWRTLFGRIYNTYPHDYNEYSQPPTTDRPPGSPHADPGSPPGPEVGHVPPWPPILDHPDGPNLNDIDIRDRLIYAALTERTLFYDQKLAGWDDFEDAEQFIDTDWPFDASYGHFHHTPGGAPRRGPDKNHETTEELLHPNEPTRTEREIRRKAAERNEAERKDDEQPPPF